MSLQEEKAVRLRLVRALNDCDRLATAAHDILWRLNPMGMSDDEHAKIGEAQSAISAIHETVRSAVKKSNSLGGGDS